MEEEDKEVFSKVQIKLANQIMCMSLIPILGVALQPMIIKSITEDNLMNFSRDAGNFNFVFYCGAMIGPICCILCQSHKCPRKDMLIVSTLNSLLGWIVMLLSFNYSMLLYGRIIAGVAMGIQIVAIYYYSIECLYNSELRRVALVRDKLGFCIGIILVSFVGEIVPWRVVIFLGILIHICACLFIFKANESPYYLLLRTGAAAARSAFDDLVQVNNPTTSAVFNKIIGDVRRAQEKEGTLNVASLYFNKKSLAKAWLYIFYELWEIVVLYRYIPYLVGTKKILIVISSIIFTVRAAPVSEMGDWNLNRYRFVKRVIQVTLVSKAIVYVILSYINDDYIKSHFMIWSMMGFLSGHVNGWLRGHAILVPSYVPYYKIVILIPFLLLCKFAAATCLIRISTPVIIEGNYFSIILGLIEILFVVFISKISC